MKMLKSILTVVVLLIFLLLLFWAGREIYGRFQERKILEAMVERLSADSRIAEVVVTQSRFNESKNAVETTIKFLEYDAAGKPLQPRYFTFEGNIIQFQTLVVRFTDAFVKAGDRFRGRSAYLFLKAFVLRPERSQIFNITEMNEIPRGYKVPGVNSEFEAELWQSFWNYALDPRSREKLGVKNAQIEAPGTMFVPGMIYTLKIEHDGGIRIDSEPVPEILRNEAT